MPAMNRKAGAAMPPSTISQPYAARAFSSGSVQASKACASIITSTVRPRSQSRYPRRPWAGDALTGQAAGSMLVVASSVMSSRIECQTEQVLFARELDGAIELRGVDVAAGGEMQLDADNAVRVVIGATR